MVKLSRVIHPFAVTLDHIAKEESQTEEISSAPKNFAIYVSNFLTFVKKLTSACFLLPHMSELVGTEGRSHSGICGTLQ